MNFLDILSIISSFAIVVMFKVIEKMWSSLDTYFDEKAKNLATKQDITEITIKTEQVQADFHKILGEFDADLEFKYKFYEKQYSEFYSLLYCMVCESESLRYILRNLSDEQIVFDEVPIVEYEVDNDGNENQETKKTICEKMLDLILDKYVYASPALMKSACALINIQNYSGTVGNEKQKKLLEYQLKANMIKTILKDYHWLRQQLHLPENNDEIVKLETGDFMSECLSNGNADCKKG